MTAYSGDAKATPGGWHWYGQSRPPFAIAPQPGQESVWDYPRPPRIVADGREVVVRHGTREIARTRRAVRVLETASPPTFYLPWSDVDRSIVEPAAGTSHCEWKGAARYWTLSVDGVRLERVAWEYPAPTLAAAALRDTVSFYPGRVECVVGGHRVRPQPGQFYGGWITPDVVGPFKGEAGSQRW